MSISNFFKKPFMIFLVIALVSVVFFSVTSLNNYYYPKLNVNAVHFFIKEKQKPPPESENALYSIIGFNAPEGIENIHEYGLNLVNETLEQKLDPDNKHISLPIKFPEQENELTFIGETNGLLCWLDIKNIGDECYSENELNIVIEKNSILLNRHEEIKKYKKYDDNGLMGRNAPLLIQIHRLYLAKIRLELNKGQEGSFLLLVNDLIYYRILMAQPGTWVDKAIKMVLYNLSLSQIELLMNEHKEIATKYKDEINGLFDELTIEEFNIDGVFREEFELINSVFCIDEKLGINTSDYCHADIDAESVSVSFVVNDFYDIYKFHRHIFNLDMKSMVEQCAKYTNKSEPNYYLEMLKHFPILDTYVAYEILKGGSLKACPLLESYKEINTQHQELRSFLYQIEDNDA